VFEYKGIEDFDIGADYGKNEYHFFLISGEDDFWALINYYRYIFKQFDYFLDRYEIIKNNTGLSTVVQTKMKEHNANLCLSLLEKSFESSIRIRKMLVNELTPEGIYNTYPFFFYYFASQDAKKCYEQGLAYAKSNLHSAAIRYFSKSIKLSPDRSPPFFYRGLSYLFIKKYDKAIEDFTQAINFNPEDSEAFILRSFAYKVTDDFDKAIMDLAKSLELNPSDRIAHALKELIEHN